MFAGSTQKPQKKKVLERFVQSGLHGFKVKGMEIFMTITNLETGECERNKRFEYDGNGKPHAEVLITQNNELKEWIRELGLIQTVNCKTTITTVKRKLKIKLYMVCTVIELDLLSLLQWHLQDKDCQKSHSTDFKNPKHKKSGYGESKHMLTIM